jgi:hypothetical protein
VPDVAIFATRKKLEPPAYAEGFSQLFEVTLDDVSRQVHVAPMPR